ncbi:hypothetical protein [Paenibacillus sp. FSL E2-0178]|uniref:hypothetical protein n=1 Tax=Paenibacillus sp. FSL E2-0178 TaxID=2921361 RepID=UPI003159563B
MSYSEALKAVCERYAKSGADCKWIIVGSVASVLQGAEMTPGDLDLYAQNAGDAAVIASVLEPFSLKVKPPLSWEQPGWLSSIEEPLFTQSFASGFTWTKGKWIIEGFDVEAVHISDSAGIPDSEDGAGIWEGGQSIWSYAKQVPFDGYTVPVVPLEIQLESNIRRNRMDRAEAILRVFKDRGYNETLLQKALSDKSRRMIEDSGNGWNITL